MSDWLVPDPDEAFKKLRNQLAQTNCIMTSKDAFKAGIEWQKNDQMFKHWKEKESDLPEWEDVERELEENKQTILKESEGG